MLRNVEESVERLRRAPRRSPSDAARELMAAIFAPLARLLHRMNVTPNAITVIGCLLSFLGGTLLALGLWPVAVGVIVFASLMDGIDGLLARLTQQNSRFGAFLDSVLDRWSDSAFFIGLLIWHSRMGMQMEQVLSIVALASSLLVSYTRARAEGIGAECRRGLFTRLERILVLVAGVVFDQVTIALWITAALSTFTALQRIYYTWQYVKANPEH